MVYLQNMKIMFLCHGNICRSPMAEYIMKDLVNKACLTDRVIVSSAAVSDEEEGNPIYPPALRKLKDKGIPTGIHRAHRITRKEFDDSDLVIVMDRSNLDFLSYIVGQNQVYNSRKVHMMMEYAEIGTNLSTDKPTDKSATGRAAFNYPSVADPWYTRDFEKSYSDILAGCKGLLAAVSNEAEPQNLSNNAERRR